MTVDRIMVQAAVDAWRADPSQAGVNLAAYAAEVLPRLLDERDRLAAQVQRVRDLADSYVSDGPHSACIDGACNACIAADIRRALDGAR